MVAAAYDRKAAYDLASACAHWPKALAGTSALAGEIAGRMPGTDGKTRDIGEKIAVMQDGKRGFLLTQTLEWEEEDGCVITSRPLQCRKRRFCG